MNITFHQQSEDSECGLACIAMIASAHGKHFDLRELRSRVAPSSKGASLTNLIDYARSLDFSARPVRLELDDLSELDLPCVLHWDLNHFVVLTKVSRGTASILDPAVGERRLPLENISHHFTGVALELVPNANFVQSKPKPRLQLAQLTGRIKGLGRALAQIFLVAVALEALALMSPLFTQTMVDEVFSSGDKSLMSVLVGGFSLLLIIETTLHWSRSWMVMVLSQTINLQWSGNVFAHLVRLPVSYFERRNLGDIVSRFGSVGAIQRTLTSSVIEAILDGVMALAALVAMVLYSPTLAGIPILAVAIYGAVRWISYRALRAASAERIVLAAKEGTHFIETLRAITSLKLFGREDERRIQWQNILVDIQNRDVRTTKMNTMYSVINSLVFGAENILIYAVGANLLEKAQRSAGSGHAFTVGMLFAFLAYKGQFTSRISALINYSVELRMLGLHADRLGDITLTVPEARLDQPEVAVIGDSDLSHLQPSLELKSVSFRYSEFEPWVLRNLNLRIEANESVAITGQSGCGKTTLLKIILGILQPTSGEILYGGVPIRQLGLVRARKEFGAVMQEDCLLTGSILENICFFAALPDVERIKECARIAQLHEAIQSMPMGYQTRVGDMGSGLSGGQKQRLLLARALYKSPRVLALDEATSHLDGENEREVARELATLKMTRIIIAHRAETIAGAQRVVQFRDGHIEEVVKAIARVA